MTFGKIKLGITVLAAGILVAFVTLFLTSTHAFRSSELTIPKISLEATYVEYGTVDALDSDAELIVIGTPLKDFDDRQHIVTTFDDGNIQDFYTLTEIKINKVIKAPEAATLAVDDSLTIIEPISYIENVEGKKKITYEDYTELKQNQKSIIFLKKNTQGQYSIINMDLGKFSLDTLSQPLSTLAKNQDPKVEFRKSVLERYDLK